MALDLRRGTVQRLLVEGRSVGKGGRVSVSKFELAGVKTEFISDNLAWGADPIPPTFGNGDYVIAAGRVLRSGVFNAYSVYDPRVRQEKSSPTTRWMVYGGLFIVGGIVILSMTYTGTSIPQSDPMAYFLGLLAVFMGSFFLEKGVSLVAAKQMVLRAANTK